MSALKELNCANNQLTQLNLKNMISLKELRCQNNQLTALDVSSSPNLTTLVLKNNHLTSLNLDNNPNLNFTITDVYHSDFNNVYTVTLTPDRTFDLSALPGNFDKSRVTGWVNGTVKGNILTVNEGTKVVYYGYQCITGGIKRFGCKFHTGCGWHRRLHGRRHGNTSGTPGDASHRRRLYGRAVTEAQASRCWLLAA